jgi:uncharacterized protein (TIGR00369 family)
VKPRFAGYAERVRANVAAQGFLRHNGVRITAIEPGVVELTIDVGNQHTQRERFVHGGMMATLADSSSGLAAMTLLDEGDNALTVEFKLNFLRPAVGERMVARGRVIRAGRRISVMEADIFAVTGDVETPVAKALVTYATVPEQED